jgi:two-component response regulator (ARR-B family)
VLSANGEKATVYKGIKHGACDYIVKPVNIKEIRNIWQHVVRKNHIAVTYISSDSDDADQRVGQPLIAEGGTKSKKCSKHKRKYRDGSDENTESRSVRTTQKKPRLSWTGELHNRFLEVVNRLGIDSKISQFFSLLISPQKNCLRFLDLF